MSSREVASHLGVGKRTVLSWMEQHGVERRTKSEANSSNTPGVLTDPDRLRREIVEKERPLTDIADSVGVGQSTVSRWALSHGITERPNNGGSGTVKCTNCGCELSRSKWWMENRENHFCDWSCLGEWREENWNGKDHPNWEGGKVTRLYTAIANSYQDVGISTRTAEFRESHRECRMCGSVSEYGRSVDIHHIVPVMSGGTNGDYNLMPLCRVCHGKVEKYTRELMERPILDIARAEGGE